MTYTIKLFTMTGKITNMEVDDFFECGIGMFHWCSIRDELESNGDLFRDDLENPLHSLFIYVEGEEEPIDLDSDSYEFPDGKTDAEFYMIIGEDKDKKELVENYKHQLKACMTQNVYYGLEMALRDYDDEDYENDDNILVGEEKCEYVWDGMLECILDRLDEESVHFGCRAIRGPNKRALDNLEEEITFMDVDNLSEGITYNSVKTWKFNMKYVKRYVRNNMY